MSKIIMCSAHVHNHRSSEAKQFECKIVIIFSPISLNMCFGYSKRLTETVLVPTTYLLVEK